ncbi:MAG: hypothetical protein ACRDGI_05405 [Candidatus Limnocylindrales bacterium]
MSAQVGSRAGQGSRTAPARPRVATERVVEADPLVIVREMFAIHRERSLGSRLRAWLVTRIHVAAGRSGYLDRAWVRDELDRLCSAYEVALGGESGADRRPRK